MRTEEKPAAAVLMDSGIAENSSLPRTILAWPRRQPHDPSLPRGWDLAHAFHRDRKELRQFAKCC